MCTHIFLPRRKLQFYFWNLDGWTKQSTPWNHRSQNLTVNTVKCHFHDLLMGLVHCWSWLLPVFMLLLEDQLSEPEIMLMFKDKLKVSDLGYQLEGKEEGNMFSCEVGGQPFAVCVCVPKAAQGQLQRGLGKGCQSRAFIPWSSSSASLQLSLGSSWRFSVIPWQSVVSFVLSCLENRGDCYFLIWLKRLHSYWD